MGKDLEKLYCEKAHFQYTNYAVKRTHELNGFHGCQDAGRKSYEIKSLLN